jgi:integrase
LSLTATAQTQTRADGGEAGLRCDEMMALGWSDVDLEKRQLRLERSDW